jgi:hypothetical protein
MPEQDDTLPQAASDDLRTDTTARVRPPGSAHVEAAA